MMTFIFGIVCGIFLAVAVAFIGFIIFNGDEESLCECEITQGKVFASTEVRRYPIDTTTKDQAWIKVEVSEKKLVISIDRLSTALYGDELGSIGEVMRLIFGNDPKRNGADCGDYLKELERDSKQFELNGQEMLRMAESHNKQDDEWRRKLNAKADERNLAMKLQKLERITNAELHKKNHALETTLKETEEYKERWKNAAQHVQKKNDELIQCLGVLEVIFKGKIEQFKQFETKPRLFYENMLSIINQTAIPQPEVNDHGEAKPVENDRADDGPHDHDEHTGSGPVG